MLCTMTFDKHTCLDSIKCGGIARYTNHLCSPNFYVEKWEVHGFLCVGTFANFDIQLGKESTTDYQCEMNHTIKLTKCFFMSKKCHVNIELSLKKSATSGPKICNRQTKGPSKNKTPVCAEKSLGGQLK